METIKFKNGDLLENEKGDLFEIVHEYSRFNEYDIVRMPDLKQKEKQSLKFKDIHDKWFKAKDSNIYYKLGGYDPDSNSKWKFDIFPYFTDEELLERFEIVDPEDVED